MRMDGPKREPPRLASMYWDEFSGRQTLLSTFFRKRTESPLVPPLVPSSTADSVPTSANPAEACGPHVSDHSRSETVPVQFTPAMPPLPSSQTLPSSHDVIPSSSHVKRRKSVTPPKRSKRHKPGQAKLSTYFGKAQGSKEQSQAGLNARPSAKLEFADIFDPNLYDPQLDPDPWLSSQAPSSQDSFDSTSALPSKTAWSHLMAPIQPPKCTVHGEPTKEFTVNKSGPNKGKNFFICAR
jgi:AP endonuclease-2